MISTVPAVIDALLAAWAPLQGVQVVDGQPVTSKPDIVCVGFSGEAGEPAIESTRTREQLAAEPDREAYGITCLASSLRGDGNAKAARDRVYEMVQLVTDALAANPRLGGLVMRAMVSTESLTQMQTPKGAEATVRFVVSVNAFTG